MDDHGRPVLSERAKKLNQMEDLAEENKDIMARTRPNDVDAREKARDNYDKANEIGSEILDKGVNEQNSKSVDAIYDERVSKILHKMDDDLKDRRWSSLESAGHDRVTPCPTPPREDSVNPSDAEPKPSPIDFVLEQQASEMPSINESDGGD